MKVGVIELEERVKETRKHVVFKYLYATQTEQMTFVEKSLTCALKIFHIHQ